MSLVSFVIPAFNQAGFVARAIDSALAQTHTPVEVVVIDDGSTDETPTVLAEYKERPNVTVIRQANGGLPAARNRGLASSRGEFVCFLDSDDYLAPTFASHLHTALSDHPEAGFAYSDVQRVDRFGTPADTFSVGQARPVVTGDIFDSLILGGYFAVHCALIRRATLDAVGPFDLALGGHADYDLWLRMASAGYPAVYVDERLAFYRLHPASMTHDVTHMRASRVQALAKVARRAPDRIAAALAGVQDLAVDLHATNTMLHGQCEQAVRAAEAGTDGSVWSLIDHIAEARPSNASQHRFGVWDVTIAGTRRRSIFLHPHGTLEVAIPTGAAGLARTAVAFHPETWDKRDAGICQFSVLVDGRISGSVVLDPAHVDADRRWVELTLEIPDNPSGHHTVILETRAIGVDWYCHALFRDLTFVWS